jgi:V/A-type H+-transporting ATPase subunit E
MTTIEDKLGLFSKIIYDKVNEEKKERLEEFNLEAQKRIEAEKEKIEELTRKLKLEVLKKANIKANEIVAKERLNKQREVLLLKEHLISDALENIHERLMDFVNGDQYKDYFIRTLKNTLGEIHNGNYYIIVLKRDYERFQSETEAAVYEQSNRKLKLTISEEDFIGGVMLKDFEGTFKIDNSILSSLQESKEIIGVRVMEVLA